MKRFRILGVLGLLVARLSLAAGEETKAFCESETAASFMVATLASRLERTDAFLNEHLLATQQVVEANRKSDSPALDVVIKLVETLEEPVRWGNQKENLVESIQATIDDVKGELATKNQLKALITPDAVVSVRAYLEVAREMPLKFQPYYLKALTDSCGEDMMGMGAIAFWNKKQKQIAFCSGALLRASVDEKHGKDVWRGEINTDALLFTTFHEFGHVLGADPSSPHWPLYQSTLRCLDFRNGKTGQNYEAEAIADIWGIEGLLTVIKQRGSLSEKERIRLILANLTPFRNGSLFSPHHLPFGMRLQMIRHQACPQLQPEREDRACQIQLGIPTPTI